MKRTVFKAIFCYLLFLALVGTYSSSQVSYPDVDSSDFAPGYNYDAAWGSYVVIFGTPIPGWSVTNAEGQSRYCINRIDAHLPIENNEISHLYGDMKYHKQLPMGSTTTWHYVPFSEFFVVQVVPMSRTLLPRSRGLPWTENLEWNKEAWKPDNIEFVPSHSAAFFNVVRESVDGFSGVIVYHSDSKIELYGDTREIEVWIKTHGKEWTVTGSGGLYAKIAVVDGELEVEGLTSYEVEQMSIN